MSRNPSRRVLLSAIGLAGLVVVVVLLAQVGDDSPAAVFESAQVEQEASATKSNRDTTKEETHSFLPEARQVTRPETREQALMRSLKAASESADFDEFEALGAKLEAMGETGYAVVLKAYLANACAENELGYNLYAAKDLAPLAARSTSPDASEALVRLLSDMWRKEGLNERRKDIVERMSNSESENSYWTALNDPDHSYRSLMLALCEANEKAIPQALEAVIRAAASGDDKGVYAEYWLSDLLLVLENKDWVEANADWISAVADSEFLSERLRSQYTNLLYKRVGSFKGKVDLSLLAKAINRYGGSKGQAMIQDYLASRKPTAHSLSTLVNELAKDAWRGSDIGAPILASIKTRESYLEYFDALLTLFLDAEPWSNDARVKREVLESFIDLRSGSRRFGEHTFDLTLTRWDPWQTARLRDHFRAPAVSKVLSEDIQSAQKRLNLLTHALGLPQQVLFDELVWQAERWEPTPFNVRDQVNLLRKNSAVSLKSVAGQFFVDRYITTLAGAHKAALLALKHDERAKHHYLHVLLSVFDGLCASADYPPLTFQANRFLIREIPDAFMKNYNDKNREDDGYWDDYKKRLDESLKRLKAAGY